MIEKFGFVLNNLGPLQSAYELIRSSNELLDKTDRYSITGFYHNLSPLVITPKFAVMTLFEAFSYTGRLIATDLNSGSRIQDYMGTTSKYLYPYDLEWIHRPNKQYEPLASVYNNLPIIARSKTHYDIFKSVWKEPISIVENGDMSRLIDVILEYERK